MLYSRTCAREWIETQNERLYLQRHIDTHGTHSYGQTQVHCTHNNKALLIPFPTHPPTNDSCSTVLTLLIIRGFMYGTPASACAGPTPCCCSLCCCLYCCSPAAAPVSTSLAPAAHNARKEE